MLAAAALLACWLTLDGATRLLGKPWIGFSIIEEGFVNSIGVDSPFLMWDRIVSVDGVPVSSKDDVISRALARPVGSSIAYEVEHLSGTRERIEVATRTFAFNDLIRSQSSLALLGALFVVISVLVYALRPGTKEAWAFFAMFAGIGLAMVSVVDMTMLWRLPPLYLYITPQLGTLGMVLVGVISGAARRPGFRVWIGAFLAVGAAFSTVLLRNTRNIHLYVKVDTAFYAWLAFTTVCALTLLAVGYRTSTSTDTRARLRHLLTVWPVGAGFPILHLFFSHSIPGLQTSLLWDAFLVLLPLSTADAIVRHDLLALGRRARRVVGSLTIAVVVGTVLGVVLWGAIHVLELDDAAATVALAAILFAGAAPFSHRLEAHVDSLLRARRYDPSTSVARFSAAASTSTHMSSVLAQLGDTLAASVQPRVFELYRLDRDKNLFVPQVLPQANALPPHVVAAHEGAAKEGSGEHGLLEAALGAPPALVLRLAVANETVGLLVLSAPDGRAPYDDVDIAFVSALMGPLAAALVNAVAFEAVERLNAELEQRVAARTEELSEKNERLARLDEQKDELVRTVSHDFRSPLAVIRGNVQTLARDWRRMDEDTRTMFLDGIEREERRLTALCTNLLDLARLKNNVSRKAPVDVHALARGTVDALQRRAMDRGVALAFAADGDGPEEVLGDADRIGQVLQNLVENALKFTPSGGRVDVTVGARLSVTGGRVVVEVADTGRGIPEDAIPRLFEPFFQVPAEQALPRERDGHNGSGLGLAIVRAVVDAHGGTVAVRSSLGAGTTFTVELPAHHPGTSGVQP